MIKHRPSFSTRHAGSLLVRDPVALQCLQKQRIRDLSKWNKAQVNSESLLTKMADIGLEIRMLYRQLVGASFDDDPFFFGKGEVVREGE